MHNFVLERHLKSCNLVDYCFSLFSSLHFNINFFLLIVAFSLHLLCLHFFFFLLLWRSSVNVMSTAPRKKKVPFYISALICITCMETVISLSAASASSCFVLSNMLCSSAFLFSSSTRAFASFSFATPA